MSSGVDAASQPMQRRVGLWGATPGEPPGTVLVHAPAKLNLTLSVLARRPDRFHELESLMVAVSLQDTLIIRPTQAAGIRLGVRFGGRIGGAAGAALRRDVPADGRNLVVRAAELLGAEAGVRSGLDIELVKEIPSGAGLGGGSSDAAAVLQAAAVVWGLDWPLSRLAELGARLGSDVPWFFAGGPGIVSGRGEIVRPIAGLSALHAVIACPATGLSTALVYSQCRPEPEQRGSSARVAAALQAGDLRQALEFMHNTLEVSARELSAEVTRLLDDMSACGAVKPMLTGSGSACFALTGSATEARRIAARLDGHGWPGVFAVRIRGGFEAAG